jgi:hypothetical protein
VQPNYYWKSYCYRLRKLLEYEFPFTFSLMVRWIHMIFGIQMYHEQMHVKFEYGCCPIMIGEFIALGLRKRLQNDSFISLSQWWFDGF